MAEVNIPPCPCQKTCGKCLLEWNIFGNRFNQTLERVILPAFFRPPPKKPHYPTVQHPLRWQVNILCFLISSCGNSKPEHGTGEKQSSEFDIWQHFQPKIGTNDLAKQSSNHDIQHFVSLVFTPYIYINIEISHIPHTTHILHSPPCQDVR